MIWSHIATTISFNPHTHEGCDRERGNGRAERQVSIHTPTKGVTHTAYSYGPACSGFNPHTHEGCDTASLLARIYYSSFNPHTHEGCDSCSMRRLTTLRSFNPHTHEGCDLTTTLLTLSVWSFNPHTHEGCDVGTISYGLVQVGFNPHTHEGCDRDFTCRPSQVWQVSIHTPTKGVTPYSSDNGVPFKFQSTHPRRV